MLNAEGIVYEVLLANASKRDSGRIWGNDGGHAAERAAFPSLYIAYIFGRCIDLSPKYYLPRDGSTCRRVPHPVSPVPCLKLR